MPFLLRAPGERHLRVFRLDSKLRTMFCELPSEQNEEEPSKKPSLVYERSEIK